MIGLVATAEQASVDLGMKRFDPAFHDFRETGVLANLGDGEPSVGQKLSRSSGREESVTKALGESGGEFENTALVAHRKKGEFFHKRPFVRPRKMTGKPNGANVHAERRMPQSIAWTGAGALPSDQAGVILRTFSLSPLDPSEPTGFIVPIIALPHLP